MSVDNAEAIGRKPARLTITTEPVVIARPNSVPPGPVKSALF
ncbi:hypothetical protein [Inquilinus limosus]|nr:hypothetical protein [Inquilinus limosus]